MHRFTTAATSAAPSGAVSGVPPLDGFGGSSQSGHWARRALGTSLLLLSLSAPGAELRGLVVSITDGDSLVVLDEAKTQHKVRLLGIDAPERAQAFGTVARQNLAALTFQKPVVVEWDKTDRYGRILGKVLVGGLDVNLQQIDQGLAWHYKTYQRDQPAEDRQRYAAAEANARMASVGLWADPNPVPPWEFRRARRPAAGPAGASVASPPHRQP
jgi:endonuclease YncB( thermonuclease family)